MPDLILNNPDNVAAFLQQQAAPTPMANPFDRFDGHGAQQTQGNPFDAFDTPNAGPDSAIGSAVRGLVNGATFNLGEPITAAIQATVGDPTNPTSHAADWSARYHENLAALRNVGMSDAIAHPIASFGGVLAGSLANPANRILPPITNVRDAVTTGARLGLGYGLGAGVTNDQSMADVIDQGTKGAIFGGAAGGALHGVGSAASRALQPHMTPSLPALKETARNAYRASDNSDLMIGGAATDRLAHDLTARMAVEGLDSVMHPQAVGSFGRLQNAAGNNFTWKGLDILRRQAADAVGASGLNRADKRMAYLIQDHLDDFVDGLQPGDLVAGSGSMASLHDAAENLQRARALWRAYAQGSAIKSNIDKAAIRASAYSQAGHENAIRAQFRKLALNDRGMERLDPDVQDAVRKVAMGTPLNLALRGLGKFAPHGLHSAVMGGGVGYAMGGPLGSAAVMAGGELARLGATAMTRSAANDALAASMKLPPGITLPPALPPSLLRLQAIEAAKSLPRLTPSLAAATQTPTR